MKKTIAFLMSCLFMCLAVGCANGSVLRESAHETTKPTITVVVDGWLAQKYAAALKTYQQANQETLTLKTIEVPIAFNEETKAKRAELLLQLRTQTLAGDAVDVFLGCLAGGARASENSLFPDVQKAMVGEAFYNLAKEINFSSENSTMPNYLQALLPCGQWEEAQYFLPISYFVTGVFLSEKTGVDPLVFQEKPMRSLQTWEQTMRAHLPKAALSQLNSSVGDVLLQDVWSFDYANQSIAQNDAAFEQWKRQTEVIQKDILGQDAQFAVEWNYPDLLNARELSAFQEDSAEDVGTIDYGSLMFAPCPNGDGVTAIVDAYAAVAASTQYPKEAARLVQYLLSDTVQQTIVRQPIGSPGGFSANTAAVSAFAQRLTRVAQPLRDTVANLPQTITNVWMWDNVSAFMVESMQPYLVGEKPFQDCYDEGMSRMKIAISE